MTQSYYDVQPKRVNTIPRPRYGCVVVFKRGTKSWQGHVAFYVGEAEALVSEIDALSKLLPDPDAKLVRPNRQLPSVPR